MDWNSDWTESPAYQAQKTTGDLPVVSASVSSDYVTQVYNPSMYDGEKYPGGLNPISGLLQLDYWSLRQRSNQLFHRNMYARGIIRRFVTNVLERGLHLESTPEENIIGVEEDSLLDWAEDVERKFELFGLTPDVVDYKGRRTLGELQRQIYLESLVGGDCLVIFRQSAKYKLPSIQIVSGDRISTPGQLMGKKNIIDGVEVDGQGRHVAYYIVDSDNSTKYQRVLAKGPKTGRVQACLIYGIDKREDGVRGEPLLSIAIQPLAEIDRYRDSAQRKATLNSIVVAAVKRSDNNKRQTTPMTGRAGAQRKSVVEDMQTGTDETRTRTMHDLVPGLNFEHLQSGEEIQFFNNSGVDANFGAFEASIIVGLAWGLEIPPEILMMSFEKNYSASQAAKDEFGIILNKLRAQFSAQLLQPVYNDWFLSMVLLDKIEARGYLRARNSADQWDIARAWTAADWTGAIKPHADPLKTTRAYVMQIENNLNTHERACREMSGQKHSKVMRRLKREREMAADAMRPLLDLEKEFANNVAANADGREAVDDAAAKIRADMYGVLVRAGAATPQTSDEEYFRKMFGLSSVSPAVKDLWKSSGGFQRPITLAKEEAEAADGVEDDNLEENADDTSDAEGAES